MYSLAIVSAQSNGQIVDDVYLTPNDEVMTKKTKTENERQKPVYKNGAREIVFIDQNGNRTNIVSDTVYVVNNEAEDTLTTDTESEEYTDRIKRFHSNERYFLLEDDDDDSWNNSYFDSGWNWNLYWGSSFGRLIMAWGRYYNPWYYSYYYPCTMGVTDGGARITEGIMDTDGIMEDITDGIVPTTEVVDIMATYTTEMPTIHTEDKHQTIAGE
ncbi:MAG: hypothetical protein QM751_03570 [Paludibacteraceae bacterium]